MKVSDLYLEKKSGSGIEDEWKWGDWSSGVLKRDALFFIFNYIYIERCTLKRDSCQNSSSVNWTP